MGELMRRYWHTVGLAADAGATPRKVRVLGEDLILFRDGAGRPGLLHARCCHRGTTLYYGRVEERGIRCCYHGWLYDIAGNCLDQPCEPEGGAQHRHTVRQPWYPLEERYGLLFAYLGAPEKKPALPRFDALEELGEGELLILGESREVLADFAPGRERPAPARVGSEGVAVVPRGHIAGHPGIGVLAPRPAHRRRLLEHDEIGTARAAQCRRQALDGLIVEPQSSLCRLGQGLGQELAVAAHREVLRPASLHWGVPVHEEKVVDAVSGGGEQVAPEAEEIAVARVDACYRAAPHVGDFVSYRPGTRHNSWTEGGCLLAVFEWRPDRPQE